MKHLRRSYVVPLCSEGTTRNNVFRFFKKIMPSSSSLSNEFLDLHPFGFRVATPFITQLLTTDVFDELLWSTDGDDIYVQCT
jgi:hypothetical protein